MAKVHGSPGAEVGLVGRESMRGVHLMLEVAISLRCTQWCRGEGTALRVSARAFRAEIARSNALCQQLPRYLYVLRRLPAHVFI